MARVNLWELITTVAGRDLPNSDKCQAIKAIIGPRFGTELSLEIGEHGDWTVEIFDHEDSDAKVILTVLPDGTLTVTRCRRVNDVYERRTVSF